MLYFFADHHEGPETEPILSPKYDTKLGSHIQFFYDIVHTVVCSSTCINTISVVTAHRVTVNPPNSMWKLKKHLTWLHLLHLFVWNEVINYFSPAMLKIYFLKKY